MGLGVWGQPPKVSSPIRILAVVPPVSASRLFVATTVAVLGRPKLWAIGLSTWFRMLPSGWWRKPPFMPLPDSKFLEFRMVTMYGGDGASTPDLYAADVIAWLEWCKNWKSGGE